MTNEEHASKLGKAVDENTATVISFREDINVLVERLDAMEIKLNDMGARLDGLIEDLHKVGE